MIERRLDCDVAIVGAGPAGLSAARAAAAHGARVRVIDSQPVAGGQVWRNDVRRGMPAPSRVLQARLDELGVEMLAQAEVVGCAGRRLFLRAGEAAATLDCGAVILATGARELLLPFPGWTLPGVTGAGGAQALVKQGWPVRGRRVLVAGSGPLLLAAADTLRRHGARVLGIHEQAGMAALAGFAAGLWRWPAKAAQAARLRASLWRVPYHAGSHVRAALGEDRLRAVTVVTGGRATEVECDLLACGFGLVPNVEVAHALGCPLDDADTHPRVRVDALQRTSVEGVLAAGEACGIGGVDCARVEGEIAGHAAVGREREARALLPRRARARRFAGALARGFVLSDAVRGLAAADTFVCRCEDVTLAEVDACAGAREGKLMTRCGMGVCQGRICGAALAEMGRFPRSGLRSPVFPVSLQVLAGFGDGLAVESDSTG